jgi:GNAT superfamily N-acetyltransferase
LTVTTVTAADVSAVVDPLFREYGEWVAAHLEQAAGITFTEADQARHHDAFRGEIPRLLGSRGRLVVARLGDDPVGVGTLKPVDDTTAEIKRMYVRPPAQGHGVGRAILARLVQDARAERYATVRLETLHDRCPGDVPRLRLRRGCEVRRIRDREHGARTTHHLHGDRPHGPTPMSVAVPRMMRAPDRRPDRPVRCLDVWKRRSCWSPAAARGSAVR